MTDSQLLVTRNRLHPLTDQIWPHIDHIFDSVLTSMVSWSYTLYKSLFHSAVQTQRGPQ